MVEDFKFYLSKNLVKPIIKNPSQAIDLSLKASKRIELLLNMPITEKTATIIFENVYEAIRESGQSLMQIEGYKPYSHEAVIAFLESNKSLDRLELSEFDNYRILRNRAVYEAKDISTQTCSRAINFAKIIIPKIEKELKRKIESECNEK